MSRVLPPAATAARHVHHQPRARRRLALLGTALAVLAVGTSVAVPHASADDLTDAKNRVSKQIAQSQSDLEGYSADVQKAAAALEASRRKLDAARAALSQAQAAVTAAQKADAAKAAELARSQEALAKARQDVKDNEAALAREHKTLSVIVSRTVQQQTPMVAVAAFLTNLNTGDMNARIQWSDALLAGGQHALDQLQKREAALQAARDRVQATEERIAAEKKDAEEHLAQTRTAQTKAQQAQDAVSAAVAANTAAKKDADAKVAAEKAKQQKLQAQEDDLDARIRARIAAAKKAAAEKAAREAAARAAAAKAAAARRAASSSSSNSDSGSSSTTSRSSRSTSSYTASSFFDYPVDAPITSPYGMRFHPVLHVWKLHDGTDFGASCGTPIRAPRAGTVVEKYWNDAYGNRLMIDHGLVDGHYVTTGYNHAISYTVSVGDHVSRGQVIGYVGTTGWSTGCHLHLMEWTDGVKGDPMARWF